MVDEVVFVYDLDGTLSFINNTFDFYLSYLRFRNKTFRIFLFNSFCRISWPILFVTQRTLARVNKAFSRKLEELLWRVKIFILTRNLSLKDLLYFFNTRYVSVFKASLNDNLVTELEHRKNKYLLTSCTNPPARMIGSFLGFNDENIICTELSCVGDRVTGLIELSVYSKKHLFLKGNVMAAVSHHSKVIYYSDYNWREEKIVNIVDKYVPISNSK